MEKKIVVGLAIGCFMLCMVPIAHAATIYNGEADFLAAIDGSYYLEDFNNFNDQYNGLSVNFGPVNGFSYTLSAPDGLYSTTGNMTTNYADEALTVDFTGAPVTAIGGLFWPQDFDGNNLVGDITLSLSDGTDLTLTKADFSTFTGFTTTAAPFTSMTVSSLGFSVTPNQYPTLDHFYVGSAGTPVPEPATLILLCFGFLAAGITGIRSRIRPAPKSTAQVNR